MLNSSIRWIQNWQSSHLITKFILLTRTITEYYFDILFLNYHYKFTITRTIYWLSMIKNTNWYILQKSTPSRRRIQLLVLLIILISQLLVWVKIKYLRIIKLTTLTNQFQLKWEFNRFILLLRHNQSIFINQSSCLS